MKTRYIIILFLLVAAGIAGAYYLTKNQSEETDSNVSRAKVVIPKNQTEGEEEEEEEFDLQITRSYINLLPTETLFSSLLVDINNDTYEDEVDIIRPAGSEYFQILPALFNKNTSNYDRMETIPTKVSKTGSIGLQGLDVVGNHLNAIVFQGIDDDNLSVMQIYQFDREAETPSMKLIGDFVSDVMVFIQQIDRNDAYDFNGADGDSYTVWIYKTDTDDTSSNPGQVQQEYTWNSEKQFFELSKEIHIAASRLAAKELSRIQDGSLETYGEFLTGLWCKSGDSGKKKYVYFDFAKNEIIQFSGDIQEVYNWGTSRVRHNGIYIFTTNTDISNLHRRIDVSLVNIDEIRLIIRDDVNLNIDADNAWDGYYKKQEISAFTTASTEETMIERIRKELEKGPAWTNTDGSETLTFEGNVYKLTSDSQNDEGLYTTLSSGNANIIQLKSFYDLSPVAGNYIVSFGTKTVTKSGKERKVEDTDTIVLVPCVINGNGADDITETSISYTRKD